MEEREPRRQPVNLLEENLKKALAELMVLFLLSQKERYVGELTTLISERSNGALSIVFPYGAIYRLQEAGCISELDKRFAPDGRRRQYFGITEIGRIHLDHLLCTYEAFSQGVASVLSKKEPVECQ